MPRNRQTTESLLAWAEGKCFIQIYVNGAARVQMFRNETYPANDFRTRYAGRTLRRAILRAQRGEKKRAKR